MLCISVQKNVVTKCITKLGEKNLRLSVYVLIHKWTYSNKRFLGFKLLRKSSIKELLIVVSIKQTDISLRELTCQ